MKVIASIIQHFVLLAFYPVHRTSKTALEDETEIKTRRQDVPLRNSNDDGISSSLFPYEDLESVFEREAEWAEKMKMQMLIWCQEMADLCRNSKAFKKPK